MRNLPMHAALAGGTFRERIFGDALGDFEDSAIFTLILVNRHWSSGRRSNLRGDSRPADQVIIALQLVNAPASKCWPLAIMWLMPLQRKPSGPSPLLDGPSQCANSCAATRRRRSIQVRRAAGRVRSP